MSLFNYNDFWSGTGMEVVCKNFEKLFLLDNPVFEEWNWIPVPNKNMSIIPSGRNIAWVHVAEDINDYSWLSSDMVQFIVFVSHQQQNMFIDKYNLDRSKCLVIENYSEPIININKNKDKIKLVYHADASRGLHILLKAMKKLSHLNEIELHIYGNIIDRNGIIHADVIESMNNYCKEDKRIILHGPVFNETIKQEIGQFDIFAYPSNIKETSCLPLIEALSGGCYSITSDLYAMPEVSKGFAKQYTYQNNEELHTKIMSEKILLAIDEIKNDWDYSIQKQSIDYFYGFENISKKWNDFANVLHLSKSRI